MLMEIDASVVKPTFQALSAVKAVKWIVNHELSTGGIPMVGSHKIPQAEVTANLILTLPHYGEHQLVERLLRWLLCSQHGDGFYTDTQGRPSLLATAQALRALLTRAKADERFSDAAQRAANYLFTQMVDGGRGGFGNRYQGTASESIHLYTLRPLLEAAVFFNNEHYEQAIQACLSYYLSQPTALRVQDFTLVLAYQIEAMIDLGFTQQVMPLLNQLQNLQQADGSVRAAEGVAWIGTSALAHLAVCWYKAGQAQPADKAMAWLAGHQLSSGGFVGSDGAGATYFPQDELTSTAQLFLEAHRLQVLSFFNKTTEHVFGDITNQDARLVALTEKIKAKDNVLDVGCGNGRFLAALRQRYSDLTCLGVDISSEVLSKLSANIDGHVGSMEQIPCVDDAFDVTFSIEAIEYALNYQTAVAEMMRVTKPGGWIVIMGKDQAQWVNGGEGKTLQELLQRGCDHVAVKAITYQDESGSQKSIMQISAQKRSRLTGEAWNQVLIYESTQRAVLENLILHRFSVWGQEMMLKTLHGQKVLEIGSGTGEISLQLARSGRHVTVLDVSEESLQFTRNCAEKLGIMIKTTCADAMLPLPFADNEFDCVWNSGLLEHFTQAERIMMLEQWARVTSDKLITLVPNAASMAYRAGKFVQEETGKWSYGLEMPLFSLREDYEKAGLTVLEEYSIAPQHALEFLALDDPLRTALTPLMNSGFPIDECDQGYLLVTIGTRKARA